MSDRASLAVHVDAAGHLSRETLATSDADYIVVLRGGARLRSGALDRVATVLDRFASDIAFGDSVERIGGRRRLVERPDFSPTRFARQDDLGDVIVVRTAWARSVGADDVSSLVASVRPDRVLHVPFALSERSSPRERVLRDPPASDGAEPLVSVIIPTRGSRATVAGRGRDLVVELVREILDDASYGRLEFVVVADDPTPQDTVDRLAELAGEIRIVRWSAPFNFSAKINRGAVHARGPNLLLLNDDIQPLAPGWIRTMVDLLAEPGVGMVGAHLLYEDGTIQHAGHLYEAESAGHIAHERAGRWDDALGSLAVDREVSGVSAACALIARDVFFEVGGMSTLLPGNYNDVDLCLKVRASGRRIVVTPRARLLHLESKSRDPRVALPELETLRRRWRSRIEVDPYWPETSGR